jgi:hypothetical protein
MYVGILDDCLSLMLSRQSRRVGFGHCFDFTFPFTTLLLHHLISFAQLALD